VAGFTSESLADFDRNTHGVPGDDEPGYVRRPGKRDLAADWIAAQVEGCEIQVCENS